MTEKFTKRLNTYNIERPARKNMFGYEIVYDREDLIRVLQGSTSTEVRIISTDAAYNVEDKVNLSEEHEQCIGRVIDFAGECIVLVGVPFKKEKEESGDSTDEKEVF